MKHTRSLTLVTAGPTRHNLFARFPKLAAQLGPIRAASPRTATRAARILRGGWAAASWHEALASELIVVQSVNARLLAEMQGLGKAWRARMLLACDAEGELRALAGLEALGAEVVHLHSLDPREPLVALSGGSAGVARAKRMLAAGSVRSLTIRDGAGPALLAAIASLEKTIAAALRDGERSLAQTGLRGAEARMVGVGAALRALRK